MPFFTYLLECADGTFYVGYTTNLSQRLKQHNTDKGKKYLRGKKLPVKLVYYKRFRTKESAMAREKELKKLSHKKKLELIKKYNNEIR